MEVIPAGNLRSLWNLRIKVLSSLTLQIFLSLVGSRRKYAVSRFVVWCAYLFADSIAIMALVTISKHITQSRIDDKPSMELNAFWAPFLLFHLGGPDTITAYSLEDNNLWLRHYIGLGSQTVITVYILVMTRWTGWLLHFLSIQMTLVGFIKYNERLLAQRLASYEKRRDWRPDSAPNYSKLIKEYHLKIAEGYHVMPDEVLEVKGVLALSLSGKELSSDVDILLKAYGLHQRFKGLFVDLLLRDVDRDTSQFIFTNMSFKDAFKCVETELGLMYDFLYTKASIIRSFWGFACRFFSSALIVSTLVAFSLVEKSYYSKFDVAITLFLLVAAILLDLRAILSLLVSDHGIAWLFMLNKYSTSQATCLLQGRIKMMRWSNSMAQFSLLSFSVNQSPKLLRRILKFIDQKLEIKPLLTYENISEDLKESIFKHLMGKLYEESRRDADLKFLCTYRGGNVLKKFNRLKSLGWSTDVEFDQSILIWHIATELCYYKDGILVEGMRNSKMSMNMSQYMLYLLVIYPFMLPTGIGKIRFQDTTAEVMNFFAKRPISNRSEDYDKLLQEKLKLSAFTAAGDRSKSVVFDACKLASQLQNISDKEEKWKMIREVWLEMLTYAACQCSGNYHAEQLRRGGELLTHVWLLMAHLGISEKFKMSEGHVIAKLIVK